MKKVITYVKENISLMHNDIDFVRTMSVYFYLVIAASFMAIGLYIGIVYGN